MGKPDRPCFEYQITGDTLNESGTINFGDVKLLPLGPDETAEVTIEPARGFDFGAGPGKQVRRKVTGGTVGLFLDGRGRPLILPQQRSEAQKMMTRWVTAMEMYPEMEPALV